MIAPAPQPIVADISLTASSNWRRHLAAAAAWSVFAGFHALALVFFGVYAVGYWVLPDTGTSLYIAVYRIGMASQHYRAIAVAFGSVAAVHCWLLLQMIVLSALFSSTGLLGISGPCYDLLLLLREAIETALQTVQAYRMSQHLARAWLNQFYVGLLVVNCWLMAVVHTAFHHSITTRYFVTLLCDLMLDFATSVGVPSALAILYAEDVDIRAANLFGLKWFEDVWQINAMNEFQLILVVSWADLTSRLVFALSMDGIDGRVVEINDDLQALYPPSMTKLVVRHCPSFEMPPIIRSFPNFVSLKIYNTSIDKWDQDAALTKSSHPFFSILMLIRVRFVDGLIPLGLQADDFPPTLGVFGFLTTNIRSIPDDLDSKWASGSIIHFDTSQLTEVPDVLLRLLPKALELAGNPIHSVPEELFQLVGNEYIGLGYTNISALPENVTTPSNTLKSFNLDGTNVSSIPVWVDEWLTFPDDTGYSERISASGSPYCAERDRIFSGEQAAFMTSTSSRLMNASTANWGYLKGGVACTPTQMYRYPLWVEDLVNALP